MMAAPKLSMGSARPAGQKDRKERETEAQEAVASKGWERRKLGRDTQIAVRTFPKYKDLLHDLAVLFSKQEGRTVTYAEALEKALEIATEHTREQNEQ